MRSHRTAQRLALLIAIAALVGATLGCTVTQVRPAQNPEIAETMHEIDTYRGRPGMRSLDQTRSDDATYLATGDRLTTAAIQFPGQICRIQLSDVLLTTLKNNRSIRIEDYNRTIAEEGITAAKGIYDLLVSASWQYNKSKGQRAVVANPSSPRNSLAKSRSRSWDLDMGLQQLVPSGGVVSLFFTRSFNKSYAANSGDDLGESVDPYDWLTAGIGFTQPLLKGFGPAITNAPIHIAQITQEMAAESFRNTVINQLADAVNDYWDLVFTINNYEVQLLSLERAQELLRIAIIKRDTGVEPPNVVLQAQAEVSSREASVIAARSAIADAGDTLKRIMNITENDAQWDYNLVPVDRPTFTPVNLNERAMFQEALRQRPDYLNTKFQMEIARIDQRVAKNNKLPQLDLSGSYALTGMGESFSKAKDSLETADYETWSTGLTFSYPLQNRTASAVYRQSEQQVEQLGETLRNLEDVIRLEVRTAVRALETNLRLIKAYQATVESEKAKLDSQLKRYEVGFATIFEVLEFQEDVASAQVQYLESVVDYNKALVELQRVKASFLQDYRIEVLEKDAATPVKAPVAP